MAAAPFGCGCSVFGGSFSGGSPISQRAGDLLGWSCAADALGNCQTHNDLLDGKHTFIALMVTCRVKATIIINNCYDQ